MLASLGKELTDLTIATLQMGKVESIALDLYVNVQQNFTLTASGGEIHVSGFFEP